KVNANDAEYNEVVARYTNADGTKKPGWLKAPNGKPTNLTERQWVQVRTPAFKQWFGDWENDPENASKVVDENGEPLAVFHGTEKGGFTEFVDTDDIGYFFARDLSVAESYSGGGELFAPKRTETWEDAFKEAQGAGTGFDNATEGFAVYDEYNLRQSEVYSTVEELEENWSLEGGESIEAVYRVEDDEGYENVYVKDDLEEFIQDYVLGRDRRLEYEVFLNIRDPLVVNGGGSNWHNVYDLSGKMVTYDELTDEQKEKIANNMGVEVEDLAGYQDGDIPVFDVEHYHVAYSQRTRAWVAEAAEMGCDGVIFRNITDAGKYGRGYLSASDVFVAMNPNQIKSTKNLAPTDNPDIRYRFQFVVNPKDVHVSISDKAEGAELLFVNSQEYAIL
ncbi:MAG: hypothetical protein IJV69_03085, partial [Kiritimatiellae bacterium]|nr:hypothetical protein [Kiritimatiellia bacterium]